MIGATECQLGEQIISVVQHREKRKVGIFCSFLCAEWIAMSETHLGECFRTIGNG